MTFVEIAADVLGDKSLVDIIVIEKAETDETGKHISTRVLETYSMADVVKTLAKIYSG